MITTSKTIGGIALELAYSSATADMTQFIEEVASELDQKGFSLSESELVSLCNEVCHLAMEAA